MKYRSDIDGLRALAVVPVVLFHAGLPWIPGGFVGVDVFFVISGYLITTIINSELAEGRFSVAKFYERRARRILPALFAVLIATLFAAIFILLPSELMDLGKGTLATLGFVSNLWFWRHSDGYFEQASDFNPLLHTWSLAIEEQFYVFFPLVMMALHRFALRWLRSIVVVLVLASLALACWAAPRSVLMCFYLLPTRAWELGFGACLALGLPGLQAVRPVREVVGFAGLAAILLPMGLLDRSSIFPGLAALPPVAGAAALIWAGSTGSSLASRFLSWRPLVFIGLISYSLYLWHWPVMALTRCWQTGIHFSVPVALSTVAMSFGFAVLSWRFIEGPFRKAVLQGRNSGVVLKVATGCMAVLALVTVGVVRSGGLPQRFQKDDLAWTKTLGGPSLDKGPCFGPMPMKRLCRYGPQELEPSVLLWGDSHALAARTAIVETVAGNGRATLFAGHSGCWSLQDLRKDPPVLKDTCQKMSGDVMKMLLNSPNLRTVILSARWTLYIEGLGMPVEGGNAFRLATMFDAQKPSSPGNASLVSFALTKQVEALRAVGKEVIMLGQVPEPNQDIRLEMIKARLFGWPIATEPLREDVEARQARADAILREVATRTGATYLPVTPAMCGKTCPTHEGDTLFYRDDDHLSEAGAKRFIAPLLGDYFTRNGR